MQKNELEKACKAAVAEQSKYFGATSPRTKIASIRETDELFIIDFYSKYLLFGGGGLLVYKKDYSVADYCMPSVPENIFEIFDNSVEVEVPEKYKYKESKIEIPQSELEKACEAATAELLQYVDINSPITKIVKIRETDDLFIIDFYTEKPENSCGGLLVYKKDYTVAYYFPPSFPNDIVEILDNSVEVEIPEKYRLRR